MSSSPKSSVYSEDSICFVEQDCYPVSSSTVVLSSPLVQTPAESSSTALGLLSKVTPCDQQESSSIQLEAWLQSQVVTSPKPEIPSTLAGAILSGSASANCPQPNESWASSVSISRGQSTGQPSDIVPTEAAPPRYYSLDSHASQVAFSHHLERLLIAVLEERNLPSGCIQSASDPSSVSLSQSHSLYAVDDSLPAEITISASVSSCSRSSTLPSRATDLSPSEDDSQSLGEISSNVSPVLGGSTPATSISDFIYANVDEHYETSEICNDSGSPFEANDSQPSGVYHMKSRSGSATFCHPSAQVAQSLHTPTLAQAISVPQAPRKATHILYMQSSSPVRLPRLHQRRPVYKDAEEATSDHPVTDCMQDEPTSSAQKRQASAYIEREAPSATSVLQVKKRKLSGSKKPETIASRFLATEPASLRRAASLRSEASVADLLDGQVGLASPVSVRSMRK